jgi:hypothetical protein
VSACVVCTVDAGTIFRPWSYFAEFDYSRKIGLSLTNGLDFFFVKGHYEFIEATLLITGKTASPATPELPSRSFEESLASHVSHPFIGSMVLVTIAFHRQTLAVTSFNDEVDSVVSSPDLRSNSIAHRAK